MAAELPDSGWTFLIDVESKPLGSFRTDAISLTQLNDSIARNIAALSPNFTPTSHQQSTPNTEPKVEQYKREQL